MDKGIVKYLHYYLGCAAVFDNQVWQISQVGKKYVRLIRPGEFHKYVDVHLEDVKPILRKLESIDAEESEFMDECRIELRNNDLTAAFRLTHYLLSRGFDLFGLIDAGLAVDKETIKS